MPSDTGPEDGVVRAGGDGRSRMTKKLPTTRVGLPKQLDALRAYAILASAGAIPLPVRYPKVAELIHVHESNVSSMNPFFQENGFLEKSGSGWTPSAEVVEYNRAYKWNEGTAGQKLAPLLAQTWFGAIITRRLMFRSLSEDQAIEALASDCNAGPDAKPALKMLLDYLEVGGLLRREGGMLHANQPDTASEPPPQTAQQEVVAAPPAAAQSMPVEQVTMTASPMGGVRFQVSVNIDMAELGSWSADRISALFAGVAQVMNAQKG